MRIASARTLAKVALCVALCALAAAPTLAQNPFDVTVYPAKLELAGDRGTTQELTINVRNSGTEDQQFTVYTMDYYIKRNNEFVFKSPGHYSYSCAKWIKTDTPDFVVPAGTTGKKNLTMTVPANAEPGGHYAVIFFEQVTEAEEQVRAKGRIGVVTLVTVPGPINRGGEIKSVSVTDAWFWPTKDVPLLPTSKMKCRVVFFNKGNVHLTIKGKLTYAPSFGWGIGTVDLGEITVLPKTTRYLEADIDNPPFMGTFKARAEVSYGPSLDVFDTTVEEETSFAVYPLSLLLIFGIPLLLLIVVIVALRRRRRRRRAGASEKKTPRKERKRKSQRGREAGLEESGEYEPESALELDIESETEERRATRAERRRAARDVSVPDTEEAEPEAQALEVEEPVLEQEPQPAPSTRSRMEERSARSGKVKSRKKQRYQGAHRAKKS